MDGKWYFMYTETTLWGGGEFSTCNLWKISLKASNKDEAIIEARTKWEKIKTEWEEKKHKREYKEDFEYMFYDPCVVSPIPLF